MKVTPQIFYQHINTIILPQLGFEKTISQVTAYKWMRKLGFQSQLYQKSLYFDGHERPDVIEYQNKYLSDVAELRMRSVKYTGDNLEIPTSIDPALLESHRETVFVYHDESTVHSN